MSLGTATQPRCLLWAGGGGDWKEGHEALGTGNFACHSPYFILVTAVVF